MQTAGGFGETLRRAREARGLSLADIHRQTKIRLTYLEAMEADRFDRLPPRIYVRGFARAFARAVGLDPDAVLATLDTHVPTAGAGPVLEIPVEARAPSRVRRVVFYTLWIVGVGAALLGYVGYTQIREFAKPFPPGAAATPGTTPGGQISPGAGGAAASPPPSAGATPSTGPGLIGPFVPVPSPGEVPSPAAPRSPHPSPVPSPSPLPSPSPSPREQRVTVRAEATGLCWVRVIADGRRIFEGFLDRGDERTWSARTQLQIRLGNPGVVSLTVDGRAIGRAGSRGQPVTLTFTARSPRTEH